MNITTASLSAQAEQMILNADQIFGMAKQSAKEHNLSEFKTCEFYDHAYHAIKTTAQERIDALNQFLSTTINFLVLMNDSVIQKELTTNINNHIRTIQVNTEKALTKLNQSFYSYIKTTALAGTNEKISATVFRYVKSLNTDTNDFQILETEIKRYAKFANEIADIVKKSM